MKLNLFAFFALFLFFLTKAVSKAVSILPEDRLCLLIHYVHDHVPTYNMHTNFATDVIRTCHEMLILLLTLLWLWNSISVTKTWYKGVKLKGYPHANFKQCHWNKLRKVQHPSSCWVWEHIKQFLNAKVRKSILCMIRTINVTTLQSLSLVERTLLALKKMQLALG